MQRYILLLLLLPSSYLEAMKISPKIDYTPQELLEKALETVTQNKPGYTVFNKSDISEIFHF